MPVVIMPDGTHVQMPETPPAGGTVPAEPGLWDKVKPYLADVVRGAGKAASSLLEGASAFSSLEHARPVKGPSGKPVLNIPDEPSRELTQKVEEALPTPQGDSTSRQYIRAGLEGAGGGLVSPGGPVKNLLTGTAAGVGGEVGARSTNGSTLGRLVGTLAGGTAAGAGLSQIRTGTAQTQALAKTVLEGLPPGSLEKAQAVQAQAAKAGVQLDLAQALEGAGVPSPALTTIRDMLAGHPQGKAVQELLLRKQPGQLEVAGDMTAGALPGAVRDEGVAANNLAQAATKRIQAEKATRSAAVRPLYEAAGNLPPTVNTGMRDTLQEFLATPGVTSTAAGAAKKSLADLQALPATGVPAKHALDYDALIGDLTGPYKGTPLTPPDPRTLGQLKNVAGQLNAKLQQASPELRQAEDLYGQLSRDAVDPLKQGPVGTLATPKGYRPDTQASVAKMNALFAKGTNPQASTSAITTAGKELNKVDPQAFADAVKTYYSGKLTPELFSNPRQWQGLKDAVSVSAEGAGADPVAVVRGLENFATIVKGAANQPSSIKGISPADVADIGGKTTLGAGLRMVGMAPGKPAAAKLEKIVLGNSYSTFDKLLTSEDGIKTLEALGKVPAISEKARTLLSTWGAMQGTEADKPRLLGNPNPR